MLPPNIITKKFHRIAVSIFFFIAGLTFASWASRIPNIKKQLHLSEAGLGTVLFALPVGLMASLPISGWLVGRFGSRKVMIIASLLYPLTLISLGLVSTPWQLGCTLFVFGFFGNLLNISVNTQAVGVEALYGRSVMASFHGIWSLAGLSGAGLAALIISLGYNPFMHFNIICATTFLATIIFYKYALPADLRTASQPIFAKPDRVLLKLGLIAFFCLVCEGTMFDWSGVYFEKVIQAPKELITLGYVAFMSTMAGGRFAGDWLANRLGKKTMLQVSGIVIAIGLLIAVIFPAIIPATIGFLFVGIGVSSVVPLVYGAAGRSTTMSAGVALASVSTIGFLGFLVGPPLIGFIAQGFGLRWSFAVIALLGFCTTLLASSVKMN